jgi:hypothetical protein
MNAAPMMTANSRVPPGLTQKIGKRARKMNKIIYDGDELDVVCSTVISRERVPAISPSANVNQSLLANEFQ